MVNESKNLSVRSELSNHKEGSLIAAWQEVLDFSSWEEYIAPNKGLETNIVDCTCRLETKVLNNTTSRRHVGEVILTAVYNINELW